MLEGFFQNCGIKLLKYDKSELDQMINIIMNLKPIFAEHQVKGLFNRCVPI
jgi:hypothetical protein